MYIVHVFVKVKPEYIEQFKAVTLMNAKASLDEPGIARFDVLQEEENPASFVLVEVYRTKDDPAQHRETAHYQQWRDAAKGMMAEPRTKKVYENIFPDEMGWD
jgi:quinol monooxygenase YgiN